MQQDFQVWSVSEILLVKERTGDPYVASHRYFTLLCFIKTIVNMKLRPNKKNSNELPFYAGSIEIIMNVTLRPNGKNFDELSSDLLCYTVFIYTVRLQYLYYR